MNKIHFVSKHLPSGLQSKLVPHGFVGDDPNLSVLDEYGVREPHLGVVWL